MSTTVDARGLSCPQPVLMTMDAIKKEGQEELMILVDTDTSRENVCRAVQSNGWQVKDVASEGEEYRISIAKE